MAGFNAAEFVEANRLDFDLSAFGGPKGTIPEPSSSQLRRFEEDWKRINGSVPNATDETPEAFQAVLAEVTTDDMWDLWSQMLQMVGRLCSDFPSAEDLDEVPARVAQAFIGWLLGSMFNPKA